MSVERLLALAVLAAAILLLLRLAPAAIRSWRIHAGTGQRRQQDASGRAPAMPAGVADRAALLADLGYERLGVTSLVLPVGERFAWILAATDAQSYVILVENPRISLTGIYSAWADGMWLGTLHPRGEPSDRPTLQVRAVATTLADAVAVHRAALERLTTVHSGPRAIHTMADMLALDADYRTRFGGSRLRPLTMRIVLPTLAIALIAVLALALVIAAR